MPYSQYPPGFVANGDWHFDGDSPGNSAYGFQQLSIDESFETFSLFMPPSNGIGNTWIAVHQLDWRWGGTATYTGIPSLGYALSAAVTQPVVNKGFWINQPT
jgi:hypothetical protein